MKVFQSLPDDLARWAELQPIFFTGSAAIHAPHVNVSPKGMDAHFAVLSPTQCAYIDRTGSGCETIAHAYENGRLCLMFTSFGPAPRILRLYCSATVVEWDQPAFQALVRKVARGKREAFDGARAVILCDIWEVTTSCGYAVPRIKRGLYAPDQDGKDDPARQTLEKLLREGPYGCEKNEDVTELAVFEQRPTLDKSAATQAQKKETIGYQVAHNASNIDGLPGLRAARRKAGEWLWVGDARARARRILSEGEAVGAGFLCAVLLCFVVSAFR